MSDPAIIDRDGTVPATAPMFVTGHPKLASSQFRKKRRLQFPEFLSEHGADILKFGWQRFDVGDVPFCVLQSAF
jgi:hypothetical protein